MKTKHIFRLAALCSAVAVSMDAAAITDPNICPSKDINDVIKRNAPVVYFHEKERYFPTSVEWYVNNSRMLDSNGNTINEYPNSLTSLAGYDNTYLALKNTNPNDMMNDYKNSRYSGNKPVNAKINAPMYVTTDVGDSEEGEYVNINYHMFFAYSGPQTGEYFGDFYVPGTAEHQGDWEGITVKLDRSCSRIIAYGYMNHGEPMWLRPGSIGADYSDQRPRVFNALFTHASYPQATRYKAAQVSVPFAPWGSVRFGDLTQQESSTRITWDSANDIKYIHNFNIDQFKWTKYKGRFGQRVNYTVSAYERLWEGIEGVYNSSPSWQQAMLGYTAPIQIAALVAATGPAAPFVGTALAIGAPIALKVVNGKTIHEAAGPSTPWTQGTHAKLLVKNPEYWSDHHGQFKTYRGGYIDNEHVVKLPATKHVVSHNGNMERYAGGSIDGSYVLVLDKGERVVSHQGNMRHYTSGHVDGRNVLHLRSGQRVVSHNGGMTRYAGGYVDQKHVVLLNRDEKVVSWQSGFQSYNGGYVDGKNVKIVKKAKVTRPNGWCVHPTAKLYEGDFDGDNTTDLLCKDNLRFWTILSSGKTQFGETGWCTHPTAELFVEELNNDNNYDLLCEDINHTRWQLLSNGNGVAL